MFTSRLRSFSFLLLAGLFCGGEPSIKAKKQETMPTSNPLLKVHAINVDHGNAFLIQSQGKNMLIDCGDPKHGDKVVDYLRQQAIEELDYLVVSHNHDDHFGGCPKVLKSIPVKHYWDNGVPFPQETFHQTISSLAPETYHLTAIGNAIHLGAAGLMALHSEKRNYNMIDLHDVYSVNQGSIVLKLSIGKVNFLFPGDCEEECEKQVMAEARKSHIDLASDILFIGHHGDYFSSTLGFLDVVRPKTAILSSDVDWRPWHQLVVAGRLLWKGSDFYTTFYHGNVVIESDENSYQVITP